MVLYFLDNQVAVILLLIDLSAALYMHLLLHILEFECGIALNWFVIEKTLSVASEVQCGIPQGSLLGPVLFSICYL